MNFELKGVQWITFPIWFESAKHKSMKCGASNGKPKRALLPTVLVIADPSGESEKGWRRTQK